jgi:hypothetical protein
MDVTSLCGGCEATQQRVLDKPLSERCHSGSFGLNCGYGNNRFQSGECLARHLKYEQNPPLTEAPQLRFPRSGLVQWVPRESKRIRLPLPPNHQKAQMVLANAAKTTTPTEDEARSIATDAYVYFYSLVSMDVTRRQMTNVPPGEKMGFGPTNMFVNIAAYPPADMKAVVRTNFDTLYSIAWLDLTREPMIISVPDTDGRYYLLPMLDMWSEVFASPGSRTTGTEAAHFLVIPPRFDRDQLKHHVLPEDIQPIHAPTPCVWIVGRTRTNGPADYPAVHGIQAGLSITLLSEWGRPPKPITAEIDETVDMKTSPKMQVDTMPAAAYFVYAAELLKLHPPHPTDQPILAQMKRIGIEAGKSFDIFKLEPAVQNGIEAAPAEAQKLMSWKVATLAKVVNGWSMNTDTMGVYGNYYLKRAIVAQIGLGANLPEDAIYPLNLADESGKPLDGTSRYTIHFEKGAMPPVNAFWSITLYDSDGFQVGNALDRFAVSSWMPFQYNADGSLDLYFQNENPGKNKEANWLPAPKGPFNLTMRLYSPESDSLTGKWDPPPVAKAKSITPSAAQTAARN